MELVELRNEIAAHTGQFHCSRINGGERRVFDFRHLVTPPDAPSTLPQLGRLADFYSTLGSVVFYAEEQTGEAALHIANPAEWPKLREDFSGWFEHIPDDERDEIVPSWVDTCIVIGEFPHTGNYILMATAGEEAGRVFEFDHDGFEFLEQASDLVDYASRQLDLDGSRLTVFASSMRFAVGDWTVQWWIDELRDSRGNVVSTTP